MRNSVEITEIADRGGGDQRQPRPAPQDRDGGDQRDREHERTDRDDPQEAVRLRGPGREEVAADEGVLVEPLAPIGPDDEQVDDEDGEPRAEPEPDQAARQPHGPGRRARCLGGYLLAK